MTNVQLIAEHIEVFGFDFKYDGTNLNTFQAWKRAGYSVKKGEKAFTKVDLWTMKLVNEKDEEGKLVKDENGKPKKEKKFYLKASALFTADQVEKIKKESKAA
jgi:hypothetical protein